MWWRRKHRLPAVTAPCEEGASESVDGEHLRFVRADELLAAHREALRALRLESGYSAADLERLIRAPLSAAARYVLELPASPSENHREPGGLLRLAVESSALAFRRADGKFFGGPPRTDVTDRHRDRAWRYAAFLGGLCHPLGRAVSRIYVESVPLVDCWNPYLHSLSAWGGSCGHAGYRVRWRSGAKARNGGAASVWLASQLLPREVMSHLQATEPRALEAFIGSLDCREQSPLATLIETTEQAVIDQDLARTGETGGLVFSGVGLEHRILHALRLLAREKWIVNSPGGRLWSDGEHVYLAWKPAVNDLMARLRADGAEDVPSDPDKIAAMLLERDILAINTSSPSLPHNFRIIAHAPQVPRQPLETVRIADPGLLAIRLDGVAPIVIDQITERDDAKPQAVTENPQQALELPTNGHGDCQAKPAVISEEGAHRPTPPSVATTENRTADTKSNDELLAGLRRFGAVGKVLRRIAETQATDSTTPLIFAHPDGLALAFPKAVQAVEEHPQQFLSACQSQNLLVPESGNPRCVVRTAQAPDEESRAGFVVLVPRVARHLSRYVYS